MRQEEEYYESIRYLWKVDDEEWLNQRIYSWWKIYEREVQESRDKLIKSYWGAVERFYVRAKPRKNDKKIYLHQKMAYTPFDSEEQIVDLYSLQHISLKSNLHHQLLRCASHIYRAVPEEFHRVEMIAKALYSKEHVANTEKMGPRGNLEFTVDNPRDFVVGYATETNNHLKRSKYIHLNLLHEVHQQSYTGLERSYVEVTFDFFLGSLKYAINNELIDDRDIKYIKEMCNVIEGYSPDINNAYKDTFVEKASDLILCDEIIKKIRAMEN